MIEPDSKLHVSVKCDADVQADRALIFGKTNWCFCDVLCHLERPVFGIWAYHAESDVEVLVHHSMDHMDSGNHPSHLVLKEPPLPCLQPPTEVQTAYTHENCALWSEEPSGGGQTRYAFESPCASEVQLRAM